MENRLQLALEESSKNLQLPIKAEHAKYGNIEGKNPKNKCIVCLTSGGIHIREESKSVKLKSSFIWYDLIKLSINVPLLQLTFRQREKNVKKENNDTDTETLIIEILESKAKNQKENAKSNFQTFIQYLSDILQRVLTPFELKRISFYSSILTEKVKPTFVSIMSRLSMILPLQKYQISQASIETLKSMFFSHQTAFNLSTFKDSDIVIPIAFELFPLIDYLEVVKIPEISNFPTYKASSYFLFQKNCVKYIDITGPKDDGFDIFLQKLPKSNVKTISYTFSNFTTQDLELISTSILGSNIHCIEFHDAIKDSEKANFYNNFLSTKMCSHIWSFNFNNTSNLNLPILLQKLSDVSSLSLAYCNIEINKVIRLIHDNKMKYLKYLNLSGNLCNETFDMSIKLPNNLTHIMVNDVSWNDKSLTSFMSLVLRLSKNEKNQKNLENQFSKNTKPKDLYLSISHAITLQHEWSRLFQLLHFNYSSSSMNVSFLQYRNSSHSSYNFSEMRNAITNDDDDDERFHPVTLRSLAWDENPVDPAFFDFLRESKELETLSLNSCFHETLESSLALFVDYIKANDSLKRLFVAGSKKVHLGNKVIKIIDACLDKKNLKILDLSISKCDSSCLKEFLPLFDEKRSALDVVIIDGIFPADAETFLGFLNQIRIMNSKTKISFPSGDCLNLKKQKKISQKQMSEINNIYRIYNTGKDDNEGVVDYEPIVKFVESDEDKSSSSTRSSSKNSTKSTSSKNIISVKPLKHSEFIKQPYFYKYFYEPFIPYYLELDEINEIRSQKFVEDEDENQENDDRNELVTENEVVINNNDDDFKDENENDNFTLLQVDSGVKEEEEEEEEEAVEKEQNKTFTLQLDEFEANLNEEEEEEKEFEEEEEAIPGDFNNSVNIIQTMQKALYAKNDENSPEKVLRSRNNNFFEDENQEQVINNEVKKQKNIKSNSLKIDPLINNDASDGEEIKIEEEEEEEEEKVEAKPQNLKYLITKSSQTTNNNKYLLIKKVDDDENDEEEAETEKEIKNPKKMRSKARVVNKGRSKRPMKANKKKSPNKINDEEEEETENRIKSKRSTRTKRKKQIIRTKRQVKQIKKKVLINENENNAEEEEIQTEARNSKRIKQRPQQQQNKKQTKIQSKRKSINKVIENDNEEEEIETKNRKSIKTKKPLANKKQIKQIKKKSPTAKNEEKDEGRENQDQTFQQYLDSDISTSFYDEDDEAAEKTEVDDTIMNVTVGVNDLNDYDDFETYETYELINQFTTPRQAKGSNLNKNVSKNKNTNKNRSSPKNGSPNKKSPSKNIQTKSKSIKNNQKQIKKINNTNNVKDNDENGGEFQLSPKKQNLINNFSVQYNLNDFEIIFANFEPVINNSEIWTNMNEEFSINKLFNNVKLIKEARS